MVATPGLPKEGHLSVELTRVWDLKKTGQVFKSSMSCTYCMCRTEAVNVPSVVDDSGPGGFLLE